MTNESQEKPLSHFSMPVELFMTKPVHTATPKEDLDAIQERLIGLGISSLPVVPDEPCDVPVLGVISMTDLIRIGRRHAGTRGKAALLTLPETCVGKRMSSKAVTVEPGDSVSAAAKKMVEGSLHRVYVVDGKSLVGVFSTRDLMLVIRDQQRKAPISHWMTSPAFTVRAEEPISLATDRLQKAHVSGLVVVEADWPIGLFTQREALEYMDLPRDTPVEESMHSGMLVLEAHTPLYRAAAQAAAQQVRRVIVVESRKVVGILTGFDFAKAAI